MNFAFPWGGSSRPTLTTPDDVAGLLVWLKEGNAYQDTGGITSAGVTNDPVGQWQDQSGNGRHLVSLSDTNRPSLKLNQQAGKAGLLFDGVDDWLYNNAAGALLAGSDKPNTILVVHQRPSTGTQTLVGVASSASNNMYQDFRFGANRYELLRRDDTPTLATAQSSTGLDTGVHVAVSVCDGTTVSMWQDLTNRVTVAACDVGTMTVTRLGIGANPRLTPTQFLAGYIFEVLVYDSALSDVNRVRLTQYLRGRWGIET